MQQLTAGPSTRCSLDANNSLKMTNFRVALRLTDFILFAYFVRDLPVELARGCGQLSGEGVEGEAAEEVAAEAALDLVEAA